MAEQPPARRASAQIESKLTTDERRVLDELELYFEPTVDWLRQKFGSRLTLEDRKDVVHNVFASLVEVPSRYDRKRSSLSFYLRLRATSMALDELRKRRRRRKVDMISASSRSLEVQNDEPEHAALLEHFRDAFDRLSESDREVLIAYHEVGPIGYVKLMAARHGIGPDAATQRCLRARRRLAKLLGNDIKLIDN